MKVYEGQWKAGKRHGHGRETSGGNVYEGEYANGKRHGIGVHSRRNGTFFVGKWKNDKRCGQGIYRLCNGFIYKRSYGVDKPDEKEILAKNDDPVYEADSKNDDVSGPQISPEIVASESDYKDCKHERDLNLESPDGHSQSKKFMKYDEDIISATSVDSSQPYQDGVDSPSTENNPDPQRQNTDADASTNVYVSPNSRRYANTGNIGKDSDPHAK
eukprot:226958_1